MLARVYELIRQEVIEMLEPINKIIIDGRNIVDHFSPEWVEDIERSWLVAHLQEQHSVHMLPFLTAIVRRDQMYWDASERILGGRFIDVLDEVGAIKIAHIDKRFAKLCILLHTAFVKYFKLDEVIEMESLELDHIVRRIIIFELFLSHFLQHLFATRATVFAE